MSSIISEEAYAEVEGVWKNFRIRRIEPKDYDDVYDHIRKYFVKDEPTCSLLGYSEELAMDFCRIVSIMLPDNMSFMAEDEAGEIAGVRVTFNHTKNTSFEGIEISSTAGKNLVKLVEDIERLADIENNLGDDSWGEFFLTSTIPKYRQLGLAGEFYNRSMRFLKKIGFRNVVVIVSSPYTRAATKRSGFTELACLMYKNLMGFDGQLVFKKDQLTDEHFACCKFKAL